jgi:hypothetical protein
MLDLGHLGLEGLFVDNSSAIGAQQLFEFEITVHGGFLHLAKGRPLWRSRRYCQNRKIVNYTCTGPDPLMPHELAAGARLRRSISFPESLYDRAADPRRHSAALGS